MARLEKKVPKSKLELGLIMYLAFSQVEEILKVTLLYLNLFFFYLCKYNLTLF